MNECLSSFRGVRFFRYYTVVTFLPLLVSLSVDLIIGPSIICIGGLVFLFGDLVSLSSTELFFFCVSYKAVFSLHAIGEKTKS